jgi:catechol 2,3-dioxygenase-like lactoylglutathione lyase family enzyme
VQQRLNHIALIVRDYDEAITFFVNLLDFQLISDEYQPEQNKRWVVVAPPGCGCDGTSILLAQASNEEQAKAIGNQSGGRVFLFLETDDFDRDFMKMTAKGIRFIREPATQAYGKVAVFEDLYGNLWDLVQSN